ncbi:IclR family transcriptional regulator [Pseudomonas hunanensis]|uniref:IclR family transcriptional regulator n=1 Tax=Pseudomonas hunanensis TaxID=1247546 RepID=UPI0030D7D1A7
MHLLAQNAYRKRVEIVKSKNIQSVERALAILEVLRDFGGSAKLNDIATAAGLTASTAHGLLNTLVDLGYVIREGLLYTTGIKLLHLARPAESREQELIRLFMPAMQAFSAACGVTSLLAVACGVNNYVIVQRSEPNGLSTSDPAVECNALTETAVGKVLLAHDAALLRRLSLVGDVTLELREEIEMIRRQGYAADIGQSEFDLNCVALPLRLRGEVVASLGATAISHKLPGASMIEAVKKCMRDLYPLLSL